MMQIQPALSPRFVLSRQSALLRRALASSASQDIPRSWSTGETHTVLNQVPPRKDTNLFLCDKTLKDAVNLYDVDTESQRTLSHMGEFAGSLEAADECARANRHVPVLQSHDRVGNRINSIDFHPSYHNLMETGMKNHVVNYFWMNKQNPHRVNPMVSQAILFYLYYQVDGGVNCPLTMTASALPCIENHAETSIVELWIPKLTSNEYDPRDIPLQHKLGGTIGMSMTEKQGGSDVRANTTVAQRVKKRSTHSDDGFLLTGHKWFTSAPMSDGFLTLSYTDDNKKELSCFLVPRWLPDGSRNEGFQLQRLKDKLGDKSNCSSEVEYRNAWGELIGVEGKGIQTIMDMVVHTRLNCTIGSASLIRNVVSSAVNYCGERSAFGSTLTQQPLMKNVLSDMILDSEASTLLAFKIAAMFNQAYFDESVGPLNRLITAIAKFSVCKSAPAIAAEALECHGGNGYVETFSHIPMAFRQSPLNSLWEGSGNVMCLDVLRTITRDGASMQLLMKEFGKFKGMNASYDAYVSQLERDVGDLAKQVHSVEQVQFGLRRLVERISVALKGMCLLENAVRNPSLSNQTITETFLESRMGHGVCRNYGTLDLTPAKAQEIMDKFL